MKAERLDRRTLQLIALQLQNDFAILRYLLFSSVGTTSISDNGVKNSATSPLLNPPPNTKPNPTSTALPIPCAEDPKHYRSTPLGAVGPPRAKTNKYANADFHPTTNTQDIPSITMQKLTSRFSRTEKLFTDEIATYTSITEGFHSQYLFLYDIIGQLEPGNSDAVIWKIPSVKFVFDSAKTARPSSDSLIEPATNICSPIFRTHPHGYNFFIKFYPYGI